MRKLIVGLMLAGAVCMEPWNVCVESTPEACAAAGSRTFPLLGICWRMTVSCESP
jgi:hypothetical protein